MGDAPRAVPLSRILIADRLDRKCREVLENNGFQVTERAEWGDGELADVVKDYDALIVRSATKVTRDVISAGSGGGKLKLIGRAGVGVDNIDCAAATEHKVVVMNTPSANTLSAAEHTCALIMSLARRIPEAVASVKAGQWARSKLTGSELSGKTLGIVGLGKIGREVALRMQAFGMTTIGYDPLVSSAESGEFSVEWLELEDLWPRCDYITVHVPLIAQTRNLISSEVLSKCKRGVRLLNVSRGGIIDEAALLLALEDGRCAGAALDVYTQEPPCGESVGPPLSTLIQHPRVVCTPHLGASTQEAQQRCGEDVARQIIQLATEGQRIGILNPEVLEPSKAEAS